MGVVKLDATLTVGPPTVSSDGGFPGMRVDAPIKLTPPQKSYGVASGVLTRRLSTAAPAWAPLQGVGATDTVTRGNFLYVKADTAILLRLTHDDGVGGNTLVIVPTQGLLLLEFQETKYLKLLEAQGSATLEYFVSGTQ